MLPLCSVFYPSWHNRIDYDNDEETLQFFGIGIKNYLIESSASISLDLCRTRPAAVLGSGAIGVLRKMRVAIQGCCHDELNKIYGKIAELQKSSGTAVDLLLICGDFQGIRSEKDFSSVSIPPKYQRLGDFRDYWSGKKVAPVLTIVIGGNHEVSTVLCQNYYGGWLAPNIYHLGHSGCVQVGGLRICGISGIYSDRDYPLGYFESFPFSQSELRSVYHTRSFEVLKLKHMKNVDIFMSHEWPRRVYHYGDLFELLRRKPYFKQDIQSDVLGCPGCEELLNEVKPKRWFSAHLHCSFEAKIPFENGRTTDFLALDKCIRNREHLRIIDIPNQNEFIPNNEPNNESNHELNNKPNNDFKASKEAVSDDDDNLILRRSNSVGLCFDLRWLAILYLYQNQIPRLHAPHTTGPLDEQKILETEQMLSSKLSNHRIPTNNEELNNLLQFTLNIKDANILTMRS